MYRVYLYVNEYVEHLYVGRLVHWDQTRVTVVHQQINPKGSRRVIIDATSA